MIRPQPRPRRIRDEAYLCFVREHRCCLPTNLYPHACHGDIQAHHVSPRNGTKGIGSKVSDLRSAPVCDAGHRYCERNPQAVLPYLETVISKLNREYAVLGPKVKHERKVTPTVQFIGIRCSCGPVKIPASRIYEADADWIPPTGKYRGPLLQLKVNYHCSRCGDQTATFRRPR